MMNISVFISRSALKLVTPPLAPTRSVEDALRRRDSQRTCISQLARLFHAQLHIGKPESAP